MGMEDAGSTIMSIMHGVSSEEDLYRRKYIDRFCQQYTNPLIAFLQMQGSIGRDDPADIVHEFWLNKLLDAPASSNLIASYLNRPDAQSTGKFRHYLCRALKNFVIDRHRSGRRSNATVALDPAAGWEPSSKQEEHSFDVAWANNILVEVIETVRSECTEKGQARLWSLFETHVLFQQLSGQATQSLSTLSDKHGFKTAKDASNAIQTVQRKLRRVLKQKIFDYLPAPLTTDRELLCEEESWEILKILQTPGGVSEDVLTKLRQRDLRKNNETSFFNAFFSLDNLVKTKKDYALLWQGVLEQPVSDFVQQNHSETSVEWRRIRLIDFVTNSKPDWNLLVAVRDESKRAGYLASSAQNTAELNATLPVELLGTIYFVAICNARLQFQKVITSQSDSAIVSKLSELLQRDWLDPSTRQLFEKMVSFLKVN